jgi:integrase
MCPGENEMKLTASTIRTLTLPADKDDKIFFDADLPGFGLRFRRSGAKTWMVQYAIAGQTRRYVLAPLAVLDPGKARESAKDILAAVRLGRDPAREKTQNKASAGETFGACMRLYLERRRNDRKLRPSSYREIERHLDLNLKPLHNIRIDQLTRRSIAIELARLTEVGPVQANRARGSLVKFLNWCAGEGFIDSNPAQFTNKNPEQARDRVLTDDELKKIWNALPQSDFGDIVRLLMLTAQRRAEVSDLIWDEVDLDQALITLPPARAKNRQWHQVPLSPSALAILKARARDNGRSLVFGRGQGGFSGWAHCKRQLDKVVQITPWTLHDLRRTAATRLGDLGIQPHVIEHILNHQTGTKTGKIYNKSTYQSEKRAALVQWAEHLAAVIEGRKSNVTALRRA